jgi:hypothetical protein
MGSNRLGVCSRRVVWDLLCTPQKELAFGTTECFVDFRLFAEFPMRP